MHAPIFALGGRTGEGSSQSERPGARWRWQR
jgi:hypothetical protein